MLGGVDVPGCVVTSSPFPLGIDPERSDGLCLGRQHRAASLPAAADDRPGERHSEELPRRPERKGAKRHARKRRKKTMRRRRAKKPKKLPPLVLAYPPDEIAAAACASIQKQLKLVDITIELQALDGPMPSRVPDDVDLLYAELPMWEPLVDARRVLGEEGISGGCSPYMTLALRQLDEAVDWKQVRECLHAVHRISYDDAAIIPLWQLVEYFACHDSIKGVAAQARVALPERRTMAAALPVPGGQMNVLTKLPKFLAAIVLLWPAVAGAADLSVWPLTPYQVRVLVAVAHEAPLTPRLEASLSDDLSARIEAVVGPPWNVTVAAPPPALRRDMLHGLDALQDKNIPIPSPEPDKILLLAVTVVPGGLTVTARDFDVHARVLGYPVTRPVWQIGSLVRRLAGRAAFGLRSARPHRSDRDAKGKTASPCCG